MKTMIKIVAMAIVGLQVIGLNALTCTMVDQYGNTVYSSASAGRNRAPMTVQSVKWHSCSCQDLLAQYRNMTSQQVDKLSNELQIARMTCLRGGHLKNPITSAVNRVKGK